MKITFLGTGTSTGVPEIGCTCPVCTSADPRDRRLRVSLLVETGEARILIDCGPDFREQMLRVPFDRLDGVLLTHEHYDHTGGIDDLRPFCRFGDIDIFADALTCTHLRERLPYLFKEVLYPGVPRLHFYAIAPYRTFDVKGVEVLPLQVMHGALPILGYRIGALGFVTDMLTAPEATYEALRGVDVLIVNALRPFAHGSHQTIDDAIAFAQRVGAKKTYLIHMSHQAGLHAETDAQLPHTVQLAYDGLVLEL
ncbi:MAG: MBL fold metallo-hydrolase [Bacteroidaceae bacterium]|nr:MBL fold metallo-hydrolase [Bacteroidaceae bacterium]